MQTKSDAQLLREYAEHGSEAAFGEIVARHKDLVYSSAWRQVGSPEAACEIVQNVFTDLARKAKALGPKLADDTPLAGWLYRGTRYAALTLLRKERRRQMHERHVMEQLDTSPEAQPDWDQIGPILDEAMADLAEADREAVLLRFFQSRDFRAVGLALGMSEDAAQKRVSRAVERLRMFFAKRGLTIGASGLIALISANAVQAAPVSLTVTISSAAALAATSPSALAAAKIIAMTTLQKSLAAGALAVVLLAGVGTYLVYQSKAARASNAGATASTASTADRTGKNPGNSVSGILKSPNGQPLAGAGVFLSTASSAVPIYSPPSRQIAATVTGPDGRFSFPASPENRAVIVVSEEGYGQATVAELTARPELMLQPWARVEGTLRKGTTPLPGQTIRLSRKRFGSKLDEKAYRTVHDDITRTDGAGRYAFPQVAPGDTWVSWRTSEGGYELQYRYFDLQAGQTLTVDIGGRGRPVTGRAVLADSEDAVKFYGSVWPRTPHQMRRPPNWRELSVQEQETLTADWEKTPEAKLYNQEKCPIDFRLADDGTFTIPDLPAGEYGITVASWSGAPVSSRMLSRGNKPFTIGEMPTGRSDEPLDIGEITAFPTAPLQPGDHAPGFETTTLDGKPLKLADYKGNYVLLHFWRSDVSESLEEMENLKAAQKRWSQDKHFAILGLNFDDALLSAQQYATDHNLTWTQCFLGKTTDVPNRYRLRRPTILLIGPDGLIVEPQLSGPGIAIAIEEALAAK